MRSWFSRRPATVSASDSLDAYKEGRLDERKRVVNEGDGVHASRTEIADAYARGRREARRGGSPFLTLILLILSAGAILMIVLAVHYGSFTAAGSVVDARLRSPVRTAAAKTGSALQNAGQSIEQHAGSGSQ